MISRQEILSIATLTGIPVTTVEKDYVLSWVLYVLSEHPELSNWVFKGGTCLKKCYFNAYRFSEDLDFTVPEGALYDQAGIVAAFAAIANGVYEQTGIKVNLEHVEDGLNKTGNKTFQAKISYIGPLEYARVRSNPRIKFDITNDEVIAEEPKWRRIFHGYSDAPKPQGQVLCYTLGEILAEKTRAIWERSGRARDVYDIIQIANIFGQFIQGDRVHDCVKKKFTFRSLPIPTVESLMKNLDLPLLKANWDSQLKHQMVQLGRAEQYHQILPEELGWWIPVSANSTHLKPICVPLDEISSFLIDVEI